MTAFRFFRVRKKLVCFGVFLLSLSLMGFYIFQLNQLTALAYRIAELQDTISQAKYSNTALEASARQALSLKEIEQLAAKHNFQKITSVAYIQAENGPVAQNK